MTTIATLTTTTKRSTTHRAVLDREQLFALLGDALRRAGAPKVPTETGCVRIFVPVPGGGDWSNEELGIESDSPLVVEWSVVEQDDDAHELRIGGDR